MSSRCSNTSAVLTTLIFVAACRVDWLDHWFLQDVPLITNVGSEFNLKPVNFFTTLASLDIIENDTFVPCTPQQGSALFNYTYSGPDGNPQLSSSAFTVPTPLPPPSPVAANATGLLA